MPDHQNYGSPDTLQAIVERKSLGQHVYENLKMAIIRGDMSSGSRVVENKLISNAYPDRYSRMTFLILLNDDFSGGMTAFYVDKNDPSQPARRAEDVKVAEIRTPAGGALCFPHGTHPLHCLHSSEPVLSGIKYIIRTDVLFER